MGDRLQINAEVQSVFRSRGPSSVAGNSVLAYLFVAIGGALGSIARYWCSLAVAARVDGALPWGTVFVNVIGSCLIGIAFGVLEPSSRWQASVATRDFVTQFFMVGVLGGFTTFSSFSLQTLTLLREQQWLAAGANVILSVVLCLAAVWAGFAIASASR